MEIMMIRLALSTFNPREIPYLLVTFVATSFFVTCTHNKDTPRDDYWECQFLKATKNAMILERREVIAHVHGLEKYKLSLSKDLVYL